MKIKSKHYSNISTGIMIAFIAALFLFPSFKGKVMQGLMKVGLFQPKVPNPDKVESLENEVNIEELVVAFDSGNGKTTSLADLKGKVIFINFWATWCPPCIAEMPTIQKLYSEFRDNDATIFMMVDVDGKRDKSQRFMDKRNLDLPLYTPVSSIPSSYLGGAIPTTLVFNKQGDLVFKHEGMGDFSSSKFRSFIRQLVNE